jgi:hypothetical protein
MKYSEISNFKRSLGRRKYENVDSSIQKEIGLYYILNGINITSRKYRSYSFHQLQYYRKKILSGKHWGKFGGFRVKNCKLLPDEKILIINFVQALCIAKNNLTLHQYWINFK